MEVPEKIYITNDRALMYFHTDKLADDDIEYIRTDAFIEKSLKYIANHFLAPGMDNEIKDFVNYMKGE